MKLYLCKSIGKPYDGDGKLSLRCEVPQFLFQPHLSCLHTTLFVKNTYHLE